MYIDKRKHRLAKVICSTSLAVIVSSYKMSLKLIEYFNWYPFYIVKIGHSGGFGIMRKLVVCAFTVIGMLVPLIGVETYEIRTIEEFMTMLSRFSYTLAAFSIFWYICKNECCCQMSELGTSSRRQLSLGHQGWSIILWDKLGLVFTVFLLYNVFYMGRLNYASLYIFFSILRLLITSCIGQLSFEKFFLVRHLQLFKEENIMEQLPPLRLLINLNTHVNEFHSLMVTCSFLPLGCVFLEGMATTWLICRFSKEYGKLLMMMISYLLDSVQLLLMAHGCSSVCKELNDVQWELQRQASQDITISHRKQILTIIGELSHTQVEMSGHGFFTVNLTSVTGAVGFCINIMMVFIQFTRE